MHKGAFLPQRHTSPQCRDQSHHFSDERTERQVFLEGDATEDRLHFGDARADALWSDETDETCREEDQGEWEGDPGEVLGDDVVAADFLVEVESCWKIKTGGEFEGGLGCGGGGVGAKGMF